MSEFPLLSDEQIEQGRKATFSTDNPFCPCDRKTMQKAARWAEHQSRAPLLAEIERLTRELENVRSEGVMACQLAAAKTDECNALRSEVERLKADAERLDFFADRVINAYDTCSKRMTWCVETDAGTRRGDTIRAAIDAARAQGGQR